MGKLGEVREAGLRSLEILQAAGVKIVRQGYRYTIEHFGRFVRAEVARWRKIFDDGLVSVE